MDMEAELRARKLPILSLENARPLAEFDVLGFSLQYEMTYTNVLTILDLAGLKLRAADRDEDDPLILGGGPCATHPEAVAPFFDAFLVGDGEERLPRLLLDYKNDRDNGLSKREALIHMAQEGGVYCPSLYELKIDERSDLLVVCGVNDDRVPAVVERAFVEDINDYPFPDNSPVATSEAIFDRLSIEVARGCTEGCRFCQAGMIYRPVRERKPQDIIDTVLRAVDKGGYDEASLTSLSTADYSCIDPLIKSIMKELRKRRVSLGVSSLRAYGLNESLLDEIRSVRATGLTFAPEAGTQRMRDVVNKNVSEEDIFNSAHRIFSRGWDRMKLYFMIGLPTEEDEDILGIVETGARMRNIGKQYHGGRAKVVVSVSSHVPKPHTPFQWAAMDSVTEIKRKQRLLGENAYRLHVTVKWHDSRISYLEGIVSRGDRRVADVIETAWKNGARFDGWDDQLRFDVWTQALEDSVEVDPIRYLGTLPVDGGLPWDHISVSLAENFLKKEWKRTLKNKLSPPCGKPVGDILHHTNTQDAEADARKLVCYHCGVACDMKQMRTERIDFLQTLGALTPPEAPEAQERPIPATILPKSKMKPPVRDVPPPEQMVHYRLQYSKDGLIRLQGHSDMLRILPRIFRRAQLPVGYSWGFHPKPLLSFTPATPLGTWSVSECMEISLSESVEVDDLLKRLNAAADPGLSFIAARCVQRAEAGLAKNLVATDYLVALPGLSREIAAKAVMAVMGSEQFELTIVRKKSEKLIDTRTAVEFVRLAQPGDWPQVLDCAPEGPILHMRLKLNMPCARPQELVAAMFGEALEKTPQVVRMAFWRNDKDGRTRSPMEQPPMPPEATVETIGDADTAGLLTPSL
jgi:radical SAM family uncharacterized protein/radical SAM-linked protein